VTIGMHTKGFERLVKKMDEIAGKIDEEVIMQIGTTKYKPKNARYFRFRSYSKIQELNRKARVVVAHAGTGSVITALEQKTPVIIVPRRKDYNEVIDNQQLDFAEMVEKIEGIKVIYNLEELEKALKENSSKQDIISKNESKLEKVIRNILSYAL
jgi:UDP-N-acetylglucosamine transferase subunit ALG13